MKDILTICPTRSRVSKCKKMLDSFLSTSRNSDIVFVVDKDDPDLHKYSSLFNSRNVEFVVETERTCLVKMYNKIATQLKPGYKFYHQSNDDFIYKTKDWDVRLSSEIERGGGWGIAYANDGFQGHNLAVVSMVSGNIVNSLGWLALPSLTHLYNDNVVMELGAGLNRLYYLDDVHIDHVHPATGKCEHDEISARTNSGKMYDHDSQAFKEWAKKQRQEDIGKIIREIHADKGFDKRVSLCMIVGDYEKPEVFARCLESVRGWVDEVNVVFNYKTFKNPIRYARLNEVIRNYSWVKTQYLRWTNFSEMRNKSLDMATGDFVIWLDCDDVVPNPWMIKDDIFRNPDAQSFKVKVFSFTHLGGKEIILHNRIFVNKPSLRFRNNVHEDITYSMIEQGIKSAQSNAIINHLGNLDFKEVQRKNLRNMKLVKVDLERDDAHSLNYYAMVNCLMIAGGEKNHKEAIAWIDKCFEKFPPSWEDPLTPKMWVLRGLCCMALKQLDAAKQAFTTAWVNSKHPEAGVNLAGVLYMQKEFVKAIEILEELHDKKDFELRNIPFDLVELNKIMLRRLGECHMQLIKAEGQSGDQHKVMGWIQKAEQYYREYLTIDSKCLPVIDALCALLRMTRRINEANILTVNAVNTFPGYAVGWFNLGQTELAEKRYQTAKVFLSRSVSLKPDYVEAKHNLQMLEKMGV